jgi:chitinase
LTDKSGRLYWTQDDSADLLSRLTAAAHAKGTQVVVSVGGWTGSTYFSSVVATASGRTALAQSMQKMIGDFALDGIDIDWEYPGTPGAPGNVVSGNDSANLVLFLKQLRGLIGDNKLITMATSTSPFAGTNGQPLADVSAQAQYIDHILVRRPPSH